LESRMKSKDSCPVWGGGAGKVPNRQLADALLYLTHSVTRGRRCNSSGLLTTRCIGYSTSRPARTTAACAIARLRATWLFCARLHSTSSVATGHRRPACAPGGKGRLERRLHAPTPRRIPDRLYAKPTRDFMHSPGALPSRVESKIRSRCYLPPPSFS